MKIYCKKCVHFKPGYCEHLEWIPSRCQAETKTEYNHEETWTIFADPCKKNKGNDCKDFKLKISILKKIRNKLESAYRRHKEI